MRQASLRNDPFFHLVFPLVRALVLRLTPFFKLKAAEKRNKVLALVSDVEDYSIISRALQDDWANLLCAILGPYALWDDNQPEKTRYLAHSYYHHDGTLDVDTLKKLCFESPRVADFLIGMLFNPVYAEHYQAEGHSLDEFYSSWLSNLSDDQVRLIKQNFNSNQRAQIDRYLQVTEPESSLSAIVEANNAAGNAQPAPALVTFERNNSVRNDPFFQLLFPLICEFISTHRAYFDGLASDDEMGSENPAIRAMLDAILGLGWRVNFAERSPEALFNGLKADEQALMVYDDFLLSGEGKSRQLEKVCLVHPQILNALIALLFNPKMNQHVNEGQSSAEFYLRWLNSLSGEQIHLLKGRLAAEQKIQLDLYLEDLPYWRAQKMLNAQVEKYQADVAAEEAKASPDQKQAWTDAKTYSDALLSELKKPGTYKQRLDGFFAVYAKRGNQLHDPYTRKLDNFLARWWRRFKNWRRAPAYKTLQNSITQANAGLFTQVSPLAKIIHAIENYLEIALAPSIQIKNKLSEIKRILQAADQTSIEKLDYFRKELGGSRAIFLADGDQAKRFLSKIDEILEPKPPVVKPDLAKMWNQLGF